MEAMKVLWKLSKMLAVAGKYLIVYIFFRNAVGERVNFIPLALTELIDQHCMVIWDFRLSVSPLWCPFLLAGISGGSSEGLDGNTKNPHQKLA